MNKQNNIVFDIKKYHSITPFEYFPSFLNIGKQDSECEYNYKPHIQEEYEFIYILKGKIRYTCNENIFEVAENDMYFIQPNQLHIEHSLEHPVSFIYLKFNLYDNKGEKIENFVKSITKQIYRNCKERISQLFLKIYDEMNNIDYGFKQIVNYSIVELLVYILRLNNQKGSIKPFIGTPTSLIDSVINYVISNTEKFLTTKDIAKVFSVSESYLTHSFKKVTGDTIITFITKMKINEAKYMLTNSKHQMKVISANLGYSNQYYFSKVFKEMTNYTPTLYREKFTVDYDSIKIV